jgi:hypothetical protein
VLSGVVEFLREVADMLLDEYDRWLTGTVVLLLVVGVVDTVGPHWAASSVVWLAFVPAAVLTVHAAVRSRRRRTAARQPRNLADAGAAVDEAAPEPVLAFQVPRFESRDPAESNRSSGIVLCAAITNARTGADSGGKARSATPRITWTSTTPGAHVHGPIDGRWRGAPSAAALDLLPNGHPYLVELALKLPGEEQFRVIGRERSYRVPDGRARVTVEIHGANFAPFSVTYSIWSEDDGEPTLRFTDHP